MSCHQPSWLRVRKLFNSLPPLVEVAGKPHMASDAPHCIWPFIHVQPPRSYLYTEPARLMGNTTFNSPVCNHIVILFVIADYSLGQVERRQVARSANTGDHSGLPCDCNAGIFSELQESHQIPILCPLSRAILPGQPSRATFAGAPFAIHCEQ